MIETVEYFDDRFYKIQLNDAMLELFIEKYPDKPTATQDNIHYCWLPSATTQLAAVIPDFLPRWRGDVGNERADYISSKAKEMGSKIHDACYRLWTGEVLLTGGFTQEEWVQIYRFKQFVDEIKPTLFMKAESIVYSLEHHYAGTLDMPVQIKEGEYNIGMSKKVKIPEGYYIGDIKTGKSVSPEYHYQTAAYAMACDVPINGTFVLWLNSSTKQKWQCIFRNREQLEADFEGFKRYQEIFEIKKGNLTPKIFDMPTKIQLYEGEAI